MSLKYYIFSVIIFDTQNVYETVKLYIFLTKSVLGQPNKFSMVQKMTLLTCYPARPAHFTTSTLQILNLEMHTYY